MKIIMRSYRRVIDALRAEFGGQWHYDPKLGQRWFNKEGWNVYRCAAYSPRWDGDDDSFTIRYYRSDTGEQIIGLPSCGKRC
ncbi:MAG: hypothetical protein ACWGQW_07035 [bacterium]